MRTERTAWQATMVASPLRNEIHVCTSPNPLWMSGESRVEARAYLESADFHGALQAVRRLMARSHAAADVSFAAKLLKEMTQQGAEEVGLKVLRTHIARSTTIEPVLPYIVVENALRGLWLDVKVGGYGSFFEELSRSGAQPRALRCRTWCSCSSM